MFVYQITAHRWSATSTLSGSVTVKDDTTSILIELLPEEVAELDSFASRVFARQRKALIATMQKPLETQLLEAPQPAEPTVQDGDWSEVPV